MHLGHLHSGTVKCDSSDICDACEKCDICDSFYSPPVLDIIKQVSTTVSRVGTRLWFCSLRIENIFGLYAPDLLDGLS